MSRTPVQNSDLRFLSRQPISSAASTSSIMGIDAIPTPQEERAALLDEERTELYGTVTPPAAGRLSVHKFLLILSLNDGGFRCSSYWFALSPRLATYPRAVVHAFPYRSKNSQAINFGEKNKILCTLACMDTKLFFLSVCPRPKRFSPEPCELMCVDPIDWAETSWQVSQSLQCLFHNPLVTRPRWQSWVRLLDWCVLVFLNSTSID